MSGTPHFSPRRYLLLGAPILASVAEAVCVCPCPISYLVPHRLPSVFFLQENKVTSGVSCVQKVSRHEMSTVISESLIWCYQPVNWPVTEMLEFVAFLNRHQRFHAFSVLSPSPWFTFIPFLDSCYLALPFLSCLDAVLQGYHIAHRQIGKCCQIESQVPTGSPVTTDQMKA